MQSQIPNLNCFLCWWTKFVKLSLIYLYSILSLWNNHYFFRIRRLIFRCVEHYFWFANSIWICEVGKTFFKNLLCISQISKYLPRKDNPVGLDLAMVFWYFLSLSTSQCWQEPSSTDNLSDDEHTGQFPAHHTEGFLFLDSDCFLKMKKALKNLSYFRHYYWWLTQNPLLSTL